jgi:sulfur relay (sulfurtransferase) DsrC/TusE family protein
MSLASKFVTFLLTLGIIILGIPSLLSYIGRTWGWFLRSRCAERRGLIFAKVRGEEQEYQLEKRRNTKSEDEDWERVESYAIGTSGNGERAEDEWEGVIGFFHPFWYEQNLCSAGQSLTKYIAMLVEVVNGSSGLLFRQLKSDSRKLFVSCTQAITKSTSLPCLSVCHHASTSISIPLLSCSSTLASATLS